MHNMTKFISPEEIPELELKVKSYIQTQTIDININHFYLVKEIVEPSYYLDMIHTLKTTQEHDTTFIYLNSIGGDLSTTIQIISAMHQSAGTVITSMEGNVASARTMIFLSGDKHIINDHCTFLIHNYSSSFGGKGNELSKRVQFNEKYFNELVTSIYTGFLTDVEIEQVLNDKDLWFSSEDVRSRIPDNLIINNKDVNMNDISEEDALPTLMDDLQN